MHELIYLKAYFKPRFVQYDKYLKYTHLRNIEKKLPSIYKNTQISKICNILTLTLNVIYKLFKMQYVNNFLISLASKFILIFLM